MFDDSDTLIICTPIIDGQSWKRDDLQDTYARLIMCIMINALSYQEEDTGFSK